jgi:hypothetical protein
VIPRPAGKLSSAPPPPRAAPRALAAGAGDASGAPVAPRSPLADLGVPAKPPVPPSPWTDPPSDAAETEKAGTRRDTPTEMYMKEGDGPLGLMSEVQISGDRDTPTRAIRTDLLEEQRRRNALNPMKSPYDEPTGQLPGEDTSEVPLPIPVGPPIGSDMGLMATLPATAVPRVGMPPASRPMTMPMPQQGGYMAPSELPFRPGWQRAMDNALVWVGRTVEGLIAKFRASAPVTRIVIVAFITSVTLLFLASIFYVLVK